MKVIQFYKPGGVEVLKYEDVAIPTPGKDQILVKNAYCGVNFIDTYSRYLTFLENRYFRNGLYPAPKTPLVLGSEASGTVEAIGEGVTGFKTGDRVAFRSGEVIMPNFLPLSCRPTQSTLLYRRNSQFMSLITSRLKLQPDP